MERLTTFTRKMRFSNLKLLFIRLSTVCMLSYVTVCLVDGCVTQHFTISQQVKSFILFVTHYPLLAELEPKYPETVANFHMAYVEVEESS